MKIWRRAYEERRKVALPLLVFLLANAAILAFAVLPLRRSVASNEAEALDATAKLGQARLDNRRAADARVRKEEADKELKKFYAEVLPTDRASSVRLVLFWVERAARESRVVFQSSQADQEDMRDSRLQRISCHLTLKGDYQDIRRFLYNLETAQQFIVVEKVELAQQGNAQQNANGQLEVGLDVATYFLGGER
jgi:Tfp pilus assembly protein PilO